MDTTFTVLLRVPGCGCHEQPPLMELFWLTVTVLILIHLKIVSELARLCGAMMGFFSAGCFMVYRIFESFRLERNLLRSSSPTVSTMFITPCSQVPHPHNF